MTVARAVVRWAKSNERESRMVGIEELEERRGSKKVLEGFRD